MKRRPSANTLFQLDTDYEGRPPRRGHTLSIEDWNEEYVMLVIWSDDKHTNEAIVSKDQLIELANAIEDGDPKWGVRPLGGSTPRVRRVK